jgi:hypothetical protein
MRDSPLMINPVYLNFLLDGVPSRISRTPLSTNGRVRSTDPDEILQRGAAPSTRYLITG